jgi:hypothetical protein
LLKHLTQLETSMNTTTINKTNSTRVNLWVDLILFAAIMLVLAPSFTGLAIHEWLGLSLAAGVILHLLLHWQWIVAALRRFFAHMPAGQRFNLVLNSALFIDLTVVIFTGLMISRTVAPFFGLTLQGGRAWAGLHGLAANFSLVLAGLHLAVHWKWVVNALRRFFVDPLFNRGRLARPSPKHAAAVSLARPEVK